MKTRAIIVLLVLGLFQISVGQSTDTSTKKIWTLRECIEYAHQQSLTIQRSQYAVERAKIDKDLATYALIPSLNGSVSHGYNWGRSINPVTNLFVTQQVQSNQLAAQSSVTVFNGMRLQNNIRQSKYNLSASEEDLSKATNDVSLNIANLYVNVIFNKELLANAQLQVQSTQEQLNRTKVQVEAGALPKSNELQLEAQLASNEVNVINQENSLMLSMLQLKQAMQLPASTEMDVEVPELAVEDLILDATRDQVYETAIKSMPEIRAAESRVESSELGVKSARGNLYPRISISGSVTTNYSSVSNRPRFIPDGGDPSIVATPIGYVQGTGDVVLTDVEVPSGNTAENYSRSEQFKDNIFRSVGISLSVPVFNGMQSRLGVQRALITQRETEIARKEVQNQLRQNVENAYNSALAASKSYSSSLKQVAATEESYRMMKQRYENGAANYMEFQVSENDFFRARSDLARAKYNFIFTKKVLDFYQNKPIDF